MKKLPKNRDYDTRLKAAIRVPEIRLLLKELGISPNFMHNVLKHTLGNKLPLHATIIDRSQVVNATTKRAQIGDDVEIEQYSDNSTTLNEISINTENPENLEKQYVLIILTEFHLHYFDMLNTNISHKSCRITEIMFESTFYRNENGEIRNVRIRCVSPNYVGGVYVSLPHAHFMFGEPVIDGALDFLRKFNDQKEALDARNK